MSASSLSNLTRRLLCNLTRSGTGKSALDDLFHLPLKNKCTKRKYSAYPIEPPPMSQGEARKKPRTEKVTVNSLKKLYEEKVPIVYMTAYDYPTGMFVDAAEMDVCLVGDSLAMVALGYENTNSITIEEMIHHCRAVGRGCRRAFRVGDMPFGTFQGSVNEAVRNAVRLVKEGNVEAVKIEGGMAVTEKVRAIVAAGIPVVGHIGLTPQSQAILGGYRVQGKTAQKAIQLLEDAMALEDAGACNVVLEAIPPPVAEAITTRINVPTIGIGAGAECSGQVLVLSDMLGMFDRFMPRFCKIYANIGKEVEQALREYGRQVRERQFPTRQHIYPMPTGELDSFREALVQRDQRL